MFRLSTQADVDLNQRNRRRDCRHTTCNIDIGQGPTDYKLGNKNKNKNKSSVFFFAGVPLSHMRSSNLTPVPHPFNNTREGQNSHWQIHTLAATPHY